MTKQQQALLEPVLPFLAGSQTAIQENSSSFYFAFRQLADYQAASIFVIYDWLRQLDDAADQGQQADFEQLVAEWVAASANPPQHIDEQTSLAGQVAFLGTVFEIDPSYMNDMIAGQRFDLNQQEITDWPALTQYCYQVAGTVGCMIWPILTGQPLTAKERPAVIQVGQAMQLTNILRDVRADALAGRCYLPQTTLQAAGLDQAALTATEASPALVQVLAELGNQAFADYEQGRALAHSVPAGSARDGLLLAMNVYRQILVNMRHKDYQVLAERTYVSRFQKTRMLVKTWFMQ
ncbi:phytoene/squalene synthase family protein [Leuconostocaceae bacterium ESL0958]|nr:phytoene/squalene synthase family protein [Leuconostocaceae bacterium ESL0958]